MLLLGSEGFCFQAGFFHAPYLLGCDGCVVRGRPGWRGGSFGARHDRRERWERQDVENLLLSLQEKPTVSLCFVIRSLNDPSQVAKLQATFGSDAMLSLTRAFGPFPDLQI